MVSVTLRVRRQVAGEGRWQVYKVEAASEKATVLDLLLKVKEEQDPTLALRYSCRMAICGSCGMVINGRPMLACQTKLSDLGTTDISVEPMWNYPVVKDLVTDMGEFFDKHRRVKPYMLRREEEIFEGGDEFRQRPEDVERYLDFAYCIFCGLCYSACPRVAENPEFLGPQALGQAARWIFDSRDRGAQERMRIVDSEDGLWSCHYIGSCSEVCPRGVEPAFAIQLLKMRAMRP